MNKNNIRISGFVDRIHKNLKCLYFKEHNKIKTIYKVRKIFAKHIFEYIITSYDQTIKDKTAKGLE